MHGTPGRLAWALVALALLAGCAKKAAPVEARAARSADGWQEIRIGTDAWFHGMHFVDRETGWIVGSSPFVAGGIAGRTEDGGKTWRYVSGVTKGGPTSGLVAVHGFDRQRACAVGDAGIFLTFDGGASWQPSPARGSVRASHLYALDFLNESEGWAAGATGVFHTSDGGLTWAKLGSDPGAPVPFSAPHALRFVDSQAGFIAGMHANLWRTRDGGGTWAKVVVDLPSKDPNPRPTFWGMTFPDPMRGWVVGDAGTVLTTTDGGTKWDLVDVGAGNAILSAITFAGSDGWIVGFLPENAARSLVFRTSDGGGTWRLERTLDGEELRAVQALDAGTAWAIGDRVRTDPQRMLRLRLAR